MTRRVTAARPYSRGGSRGDAITRYQWLCAFSLHSVQVSVVNVSFILLYCIVCVYVPHCRTTRQLVITKKIMDTNRPHGPPPTRDFCDFVARVISYIHPASVARLES